MFYAVGGIVVFVCAVLLAVLFRKVVPTDKVHIVQSKKKTVAYGSSLPSGNVYYLFPSWMPVIGVTSRRLPVSNFTISLENYEAYDKGKVPFNVDVKAFFRVENPEIAARRIESFGALKDQLLDILRGAIRSILASSEIIEIMEQRTEFGEKFSKEVDGQLEEWGVASVKNVELMDVRDAMGTEVISNIMEKKKSRIEKDSRIEVAENMKEAEIKEIEAKREATLKKQEAEKQIWQKEAEKNKMIWIADEKTNQSIQEEKKETTTKEMEVKRISDTKQAEIEKQVQIVKSEEEAKKLEIEADGKRKATITIAMGDKESQLKKAEGNYAVWSNEAKVIQEKETAKVAGDIELAKSIAELKEYMEYLLGIKQVEANQTIWEAQAVALEKADLKLVSTGNDGGKDINGLLDMLSPKWWAKFGSMIDAFKKTSEGSKLLNIIKEKTDNKK